MNDYARQERRLLADLLLQAGPDAPTLCTGWTTRDLAAHLAVRDRRPDASAGLLVPALAAYGERVRLVKAALPYPDLIAEVRNPPLWSPVSNPLVDGLANTMEFFIHHEDVRRAASGWEPRPLPAGQQVALWRSVKFTARLALRRLGVPGEVIAEGFPPVRTGPAPQVRITGDAGELALFFSGRQRIARVVIDGDPAIADRLRGAKLGF
ncbi:TIGR03085 family metal-binding protein [Actinoplanes regularis]|uniref:TIGR03085 family metal-binding protein n=1 Tax=Actinoplanes regularis TaxID=52697 RepID=UPI0024A5615F|nr:TIGR03085 family metal-binding protein [Actinoplanes regularis]GLW27142.1 TIGR03085 family protein [Actinoplanes regularis]